MAHPEAPWTPPRKARQQSGQAGCAAAAGMSVAMEALA
jgi:hypothetical protein